MSVLSFIVAMFGVGGRGFLSSAPTLQTWYVEVDSGTPNRRKGPTVTSSESGFKHFEHASLSEYATLETLGFLTEAGITELRDRGVRDTYDLLAHLVKRTERSVASIESWLAALGPSTDEVRRAAAEGLWLRMLTVFDGLDQGVEGDGTRRRYSPPLARSDRL